MRFKVYVAAASAALFCAEVADATSLETHSRTHAHNEADSEVGIKVEAPAETEVVA